MALYIPHSIFHLAQILYVMPETFGPYCVHNLVPFCRLLLERKTNSFVSDNVTYRHVSKLTDRAYVSRTYQAS